MHKITLLFLSILAYATINTAPIHDAVISGKLERVVLALSDTPDSLNTIDMTTGYGALALSAYMGHEHIASFLLKQETITVDLPGVDDNTALHVATDRNQLEITRILIENNACIDQKNSKGNTPLMICVEGGYKQLFDLLLKHKANPSLQNNEQNSAIILAALGNREKMLTRLISLGVDPDTPNIYKNTALSLAADRGHSTIVRKLVETKQVQVNRINEHGFNALYSAVAHNHITTTQLLVDAGGDWTNINEEKTTMLHYAARKGYEEIVSILAPLGNLDVQNIDGETALHIACQNKNTKIMRTLILAGADTKIPNNQNKTFWSLVKAQPLNLRTCQRAQKAFLATQKKKTSLVVTPSQQTELSQKKEVVEIPKKKKRTKRKTKNTKSTNKNGATTVYQNYKEKKEHVQVFLTSVKQTVFGRSSELSPALMPLWKQQATLVKKRKKLPSCQLSPAIIDYDGIFDDTRYHIRLFNCFASPSKLSQEYRFNYSLDYTKLYCNDIYQRLNLTNLLKEHNLQHLLKYDKKSEMPTLTKNKKFYSLQYDGLLQHDKIGKKLDLYHLFTLDPSHIHDLGITFFKTKNDGFRTVEVRIPAEISFTHHHSDYVEPVVIELSFPYDNTQTLGPCIHRFMRPMSQSTERIVHDSFKSFTQKYLTD